jgi:hypothetical protein
VNTVVPTARPVGSVSTARASEVPAGVGGAVSAASEPDDDGDPDGGADSDDAEEVADSEEAADSEDAADPADDEPVAPAVSSDDVQAAALSSRAERSAAVPRARR